MSDSVKHYKKIRKYKGVTLDECVPMDNHAAYFIMYTLDGKRWIESLGFLDYMNYIQEELQEEQS